MTIPKDMCGPQLSQKEVREELMMVKRLNNVDCNMELNPELINKFPKVSLQVFGHTM